MSLFTTDFGFFSRKSKVSDQIVLASNAAKNFNVENELFENARNTPTLSLSPEQIQQRDGIILQRLGLLIDGNNPNFRPNL